ncbi:hypothetical protein ACT3S7_11385 [Corynebacterium sp. AOP34-AQ2-28]|uniref:hypothetical protein n=1 Tax=Corynebacterium sp. AOP34-AQ2-28 TaxID=3457689 RepID=UPI004034779B
MPTPESRHPHLNARRFHCPRCSAFAGQEWDILYFFANREDPADQDRWSKADDERPDLSKHRYAGLSAPAPDDSKPIWRMSTCASCDKASVWRGRDLIYPPQSVAEPPHEDMSDDVRELYEEASAVAAVSKRAGAALARATLERLLKNLDPKAPRGSNLNDYIDRARPHVTVSTFKMLTLTRHTGNKSLHVDTEPDASVTLLLSDDDEGVLGAIFAAINSVVDERISRPKQADSFYESLPPGVREKFEEDGAAAT